MPQVGSTQCRVLIVAPNGARFHFTQTDYEYDLLAVDTEKDLAQPTGSFTLHFTASLDSEGRSWDQRIPKRSLVVIAMERPGHPELHVEDTTIMVGLTDTHSVQERWEGAGPRRTVRVSGRELSCLIVDAHLMFHPLLILDPSKGTLTMTGPEIGVQTLALAWQPALAKGGESPIATLSRILDYFLFVGGQAVVGPDVPNTQLPLIQLDLPGITLPEALVKNTEHWNTFEPVQLPQPYQAAEAGSLWNYLHLFIDRMFQEFFTRIEDGVCKIHFRGRPYLHERVTSGTRFKSQQDEPTLQTLLLHQADILARATQCQTSSVYNWFLAEPLNLADLFPHASFRYLITPEVVTEHDHPSFIGRYGLRPMIVKSPYLAPWQAAWPSDPGGLSPLTPAPGQGMAPDPAKVQPLKPPPAGKATYADMAAQIAAQQGIPPALIPWFVASIEVESNFNPNAMSPAGAQGLGQIMPATQQDLGITDPYDPVQSLTGAAQYWNFLRKFPWIGDDPRLIVAAYNAGPARVRTAKGIPNIPETQRHVRKIEAKMPEYQGLAGTFAAPPATPGASAGMGTGTVVETAQRWARILLAWYEMGGELFAGTFTVRGHPAWNVGHRLLSSDARGAWEAYIEGVAHHYDMRTGQYLTHLRLTRGWYLSAAMSAQLWLEAQTTVTDATGGPQVDEAPLPLPPEGVTP